MKKIGILGRYYIFQLEDEEVVEKGLNYGLINTDNYDFVIEEYGEVLAVDMDFYERTKDGATKRALAWS